MDRAQFYNSCRYLHIKPSVLNGRISFGGKVRELRDALDNMPELEAELILMAAVRDDDLLDGIKERASIRWAEGLSDSLLDAVLCNFTPLNEQVQRDEQGHVVLKARTDWDKELDEYRR